MPWSLVDNTNVSGQTVEI